MFCSRSIDFATTVSLRVLIIATVAICAAGSNTEAQKLSFQTVAFSGLDAPGTGGANFFEFGTPRINNAGQVSVPASLNGFGVNPSNNTGLFSGTRDSLMLVVREGDVPPGVADGIVFSSISFQQALLDDNGHTAFQIELDGPAGFEEAVFSETSGMLELVAMEGVSIPGAAGLNFDEFDSLELSSGGQLLIGALLEGAGVNATNDAALFFQEPGGLLTMAIRSSDPIPGLGGTHFQNLGRGTVNSSGTFVFRSGMDAGGDGIFSWTEGIIEPIVLSGDAAPGTPVGVNFQNLLAARADLNNVSQIAFSSTLTDGTDALYSNASGALQPVALGGEDAPGINLNIQFASFPEVRINDDGETAFLATLQGDVGLGDQAIYVEDDGQLQLVARQGELAAGTSGGIRYGEMSKISFNNEGQLAFAATLFLDGIEGLGDEALYIYSGGELQLVAQLGKLFDVDDDPAVEELKEISYLSIDVGQSVLDTNTASFNESGQLIFRLNFTDGSTGVFVAKVILLGDVNGDGIVNLLDVQPFVEAITTGTYIPAADINEDGMVNLLDVVPFVDLLTG